MPVPAAYLPDSCYEYCGTAFSIALSASCNTLRMCVALLASQGIDFVKSLQYSLVIALAYLLTPLFCVWIADRLERKWMIVAGAMGTAVFGLAFARQVLPQNLIVFGALVTISNIVLSYSYHAYQTELYPTRIRARAIGFVYSFSRLATILSGFEVSGQASCM